MAWQGLVGQGKAYNTIWRRGMKHRVKGELWTDVVAGIPPAQRRKVCETITGDVRHARAVFMANNPGYRIISILQVG